MNGIDADGHLAAAERAQERVRRGSRWAIWHYIAHAVIGYCYLAAFGVVGTSHEGRAAPGIIMSAFAAYLVVAGLISRKRVTPRGFNVRLAAIFVAWTFAVVFVMIIGAVFFLHTPAFWLAAPALPSAVMILGAVLEYREGKR